MFLRVFFVICLCFIPPASYAQPSSADIEEAYNRGRLAWDDGDLINTMIILRMPADNGHAEAQALLGFIFDQSEDDAIAADYYRKSASQGNLEGMYGLAGFLISGDGGVKVDIPAARALYERSAEMRHAPSIGVMVESYVSGGLGVTEEERNGPSALNWYTIGAEIGIVKAFEQLIDANRNGKLGLAKNPEEADRLQAKMSSVLGIDPSKIKKKRIRR